MCVCVIEIAHNEVQTIKDGVQDTNHKSPSKICAAVINQLKLKSCFAVFVFYRLW